MGAIQEAVKPVASSYLPPALVRDPDGAAELLFNTLVVYGPTGSRKTSQAGSFAEYIYEKTGGITRLISCDGGGWGPIQPHINAGIIEAWRLVEEQNPKVALVKASKGAWPEKLRNGLRESIHILQPEPSKRGEFFKKANVTAFIVEGWQSIAQMIIRDAVGKGQKISEDVVSKFTEEAEYGSETFGAPARAHYGFVQNFLLDIIRNFSSLPVERIMYTSLEGKGEDKLTKQLSYGPSTAGSALTASIPQYVGDCLHFEDFIEDLGVDPANPKQKLSQESVKAWFVKHADPQTGILWPAKARIPPSKVGEFRKRMGENGYFILGKKSLADYLRLQDEILAASTNDLREWKRKVDEGRKK